MSRQRTPQTETRPASDRLHRRRRCPVARKGRLPDPNAKVPLHALLRSAGGEGGPLHGQHRGRRSPRPLPSPPKCSAVSPRAGGTAARGHCGCRGALQPASAEGRCSWQRVPGGTAAIFFTFARRCPAPAPAAPQGDCEQRRHSSLELFRRQHPLSAASLFAQKKETSPPHHYRAGGRFVCFFTG